MTEKKKPGGTFGLPANYELDALDKAILNALPDEGAKIGKYMFDALGVAKIRPTVDGTISSGTYGTRLRLMSLAGYVVKVEGRQAAGNPGSGSLWQRTQKGKEAIGK